MSREKTIESPTKIESSGWKKIMKRAMNRIAEDNIPIVSAGVAFYAFLAFFPAIIAFISIYGLVTDPQMAEQQVSRMSEMMPEQAFSIIEQSMDNLMETSSSALGWGTLFGILISLWSANQGTRSLFTGLDIAYRTDNERGFIKQNALTLLFTLAAIIILILSLGLIVIFPAIVNTIGLSGTIEGLITWLRWPLLALIVIAGISLIYQYAPDRTTPEFKWVVLGSVVATLLWLIASWGFSLYLSNFGNFGEMYGPLAAVVILLLWLFLTSFIILLGGEINRATEAYAEDRLEKPE